MCARVISAFFAKPWQAEQAAAEQAIDAFQAAKSVELLLRSLPWHRAQAEITSLGLDQEAEAGYFGRNCRSLVPTHGADAHGDVFLTLLVACQQLLALH